MSELIFVGERQSPKAAEIGATWQNGKMSAKNLHEALAACGVNADACTFTNLWVTPGIGKIVLEADRQHEGKVVRELRKRVRGGAVVIALGKLVSRQLIRQGVSHFEMVHPAARGTIRKTENYRAHVQEVMSEVRGVTR